MIPKAPTAEELRAHVRRELSEDRSREIRRWLVRCTDERVTAAMRFWLEEARQERGDATSPASLQPLGNWFLSLFRKLQAAVDQMHQADPELAFGHLGQPGTEGPMEGIRLIERISSPDDTTRKVDIEIIARRGRRHVIVFATTDSADLHLLDSQILPEPLAIASALPPSGYLQTESEGRVTFWAVFSDRQLMPLPSNIDEISEWLDVVAILQNVVIRAARLNAFDHQQV